MIDAFAIKLTAFRQYLGVVGRSNATITTYIRNIERFLQYLESRGINALTAVTWEHIEKYQLHLVAQNLSLLTVECYIRSVRVFFKYLVREAVVIQNPCDLVPLPVLPRRLPRNTITEADVVQLINQPDTSTDTGLLHRAILECFYSSSIRLGELCRLKVDDVDTAKGIIRVIKGKGGRSREVPIGNSASLWIRAYRDLVRVKFGKLDQHRLFLGSQRGRPINCLLIQRFIKGYARKAGIKTKVTPHTIRASCATHMHRAGAGLKDVRDMLGHQLIETTQRYTRVSPQDLQGAHKRYHPRRHNE